MSNIKTAFDSVYPIGSLVQLPYAKHGDMAKIHNSTFLVADGRELSISKYSDLYDVIGTHYVPETKSIVKTRWLRRKVIVYTKQIKSDTFQLPKLSSPPHPTDAAEYTYMPFYIRVK